MFPFAISHFCQCGTDAFRAYAFLVAEVVDCIGINGKIGIIEKRSTERKNSKDKHVRPFQATNDFAYLWSGRQIAVSWSK